MSPIRRRPAVHCHPTAGYRNKLIKLLCSAVYFANCTLWSAEGVKKRVKKVKKSKNTCKCLQAEGSLFDCTPKEWKVI